MDPLSYEQASEEVAKLKYTPVEWQGFAKRTEKERYVLGVVILQKVLNGKSLRTIEKDMGIPRATVARYRDKALMAIQMPLVDEARKVELARLETLAEAVWQTAATGDKDAIASYLKISERVSKLMGMDKPIQIEATTVELTAQERELQQLLAQTERDMLLEENKLKEQA